jgi:hypothetical protein
MSEEQVSHHGSLDQILKRVDFFKPVATRRSFMRTLMLAGGAAAAGAAGLAKVTGVLADTATDFVTAAIGAERIGIAFYGNALGSGSPYSAAGDPATSTLLNSSHRGYFQAAFNQETSHLAVLSSLGLPDFPFHTFQFPAGTFANKDSMLAMGAALESIFIGAYLGAVNQGAAAGNAFVAEAAAQICGVECEHRVLINDIRGIAPPNDRFYEGGIASPPSGALGDTGPRSVVYATAGAAVDALVALGITPS